MVPVYREYVVERYSLMEDESFLDILAQAQSIPGPIALNTAILVGKKLYGLIGMIVCALAVIFPPFVVILVVSIFFSNIVKYKFVKYFLNGVNIGITAVLIKMTYDFAKTYFKYPFIIASIIFVAFLIAILKFQAITLFIIFAVVLFFFTKRL